VLRNPALDARTPERWFDTQAFTMPARGTFGSAGRNILDGPGLKHVSVSLLRQIPLRERYTMQFRVEAFNVFNSANLGLPDLFFGSPSFGRIGSAESPRHVQLGLKFLF
jgi:hypothetical protein